VAVETPSKVFPVMKDDIGMLVLEFPPLPVNLHRGMAVAARKHPFGQGRRRDRELLFRSHHWEG
jgi:hypothetical protein